MVTLSDSILSRYAVFSLYNSPYPAHDQGNAIDLYPVEGAPSPVTGTVMDTMKLRAPSRAYATDHDYLILIDTGEYVARLLHVNPSVQTGESVMIGDHLGSLVRSGYFAPWVDNHIHLGFRTPDANPYRAAGSLPIEIDVSIRPVPWDGTGHVIETGETHMVLDAPGHPSPGNCFAGIADSTGVLDGGIPHYEGGGRFCAGSGRVSLVNQAIGHSDGRTVTWDDIDVHANGSAVTGVSLAIHRDRLGVKLVSWKGPPADIGERVTVTVTVS